MNITRTAANLGKHLLPSVLPHSPYLGQVTNRLCRNLSTGKGFQRFGNISSTMGSYDLPTLENFIGKWLETEKENYDEFLKATGVAEEVIGFLNKHKSWVEYSLDHEELNCVFGLEGTDYKGTYSAVLGKPYYYTYFNGYPIKAVYYQDESDLKELHECEADPEFRIEVHRTLKGKKKMNAKSEFKGVVASKVLKRQ